MQGSSGFSLQLEGLCLLSEPSWVGEGCGFEALEERHWALGRRGRVGISGRQFRISASYPFMLRRRSAPSRGSRLRVVLL